MQYCRQPTNETLVARIKSTKPLWLQLSTSSAPLDRKVHAIVMAAWPRALHAVSVTHVGQNHFKQVRAGALRGLRMRKPGVSPLVQLSLLQDPLTDPEFYTIRATVRDFRTFATPAFWEHLSDKDSHRSRAGPGKLLLQRIARLQWSVLPNGQVLDHIGEFNILDLAWKELDIRMRHSWQIVIGTTVSSRKGFSGLAQVDAQVTKKSFHQLGQEEQALLRVVLNGTFFPNDAIAHMQVDQTPQCSFCQVPDSVHHRHWSCVAFAPHRAELDHEVLETLPFISDCWATRSWATRPPDEPLWRNLLCDAGVIQFPSRTECLSIPGDDPLMMFTDGSALFPQWPRARFAAWAVVLVDTQDPLQGRTIARGHVRTRSK